MANSAFTPDEIYHTRFAELVCADGSSKIIQFYPENTINDVILDLSSSELLNFANMGIQAAGAKYTLKDVITGLKGLAFKSHITAIEFDPQTLVKDINVTSNDVTIPTTKAVKDITKNLVTVNDSKTENGNQTIYAPSTSGTGVPYYDGSTKTWSWIQLKNTNQILTTTLKINNTNLLNAQSMQIYAPTSYGVYGQVLTASGSMGSPPSFKKLSDLFRMNGANPSMVNGSPIFYAPVTPGNRGQYLASDGPNAAPIWKDYKSMNVSINGQRLEDNSYMNYASGRIKNTSYVVTLIAPTVVDTVEETYSDHGYPSLEGQYCSISLYPPNNNGFQSWVTGGESTVTAAGAFFLPYDKDLNSISSYSDAARLAKPPTTHPNVVHVIEDNSDYVFVVGWDFTRDCLDVKPLIFNPSTPIYDAVNDDDTIYYLTTDISKAHVCGEIDTWNEQFESIESCVPFVGEYPGAFSSLVADCNDLSAVPAFFIVEDKNGTRVYGIFVGTYEDSWTSGTYMSFIQLGLYNGEMFNGRSYYEQQMDFYAPVDSGVDGSFLVSSGPNLPPVWKYIALNADGTIQSDITVATSVASHINDPVSSSAVWNELNTNMYLTLNGVRVTLGELKNKKIMAPTEVPAGSGTAGRKYGVYDGMGGMMWRTKGVFMTTTNIIANATSTLVTILVPPIESRDVIMCDVKLHTTGNAFVADYMDDYIEAGVYISDVQARDDTTEIKITVSVRNPIDKVIPVMVTATYCN